MEKEQKADLDIMLANFVKDTGMGEVFITTIMVKNMMVNGREIIRTGKVHIIGLMEKNILVIVKWAGFTGKAYVFMLMEEYKKVYGKIVT